MMTTPKFRLPLIAAALMALSATPAPASPTKVLAPDQGGKTWAIAIHGGAGTMSREAMTPEKEAEYRAALDRALKVGEQVLASGGSALDAVTAVVVTLENDPHFNAGKGAVFTWEGRNELDASIMDGRTRAAGAVAGVTIVKNPVKLARAVMEKGPHVMLARDGAEQFARENGLEIVDPQYFYTSERWQQLQEMKSGKLSWYDVDRKFGTVGAVAVDSEGHVAAATSTGGMTGKRWGRIGDSPVIGAGTYADDRACAVSATGSGEFFIREGVAHEICARLRFTDETAQVAADKVMGETGALGGDGGVIVVTPDGQAVFSFNTPGMYRARGNSGGLHEVGIFAGE